MDSVLSENWMQTKIFIPCERDRNRHGDDNDIDDDDWFL